MFYRPLINRDFGLFELDILELWRRIEHPLVRRVCNNELIDSVDPILSVELETSMLHTERHPARVFCSYSHLDEEFRAELEGHLYSLIRQELMILWYDRRIAAGSNWKEEIPKELDEADIILLLISSLFISSDYCYNIEMGRALQRHEEGTAVVIPVFIRAAHYEGLPFADLQGLPPDGRSVSEYENRDKAWAIVVEGVNQTLKKLSHQLKSQATPRTIISSSEKETYEANTYLRHLVAFNRRQMFGIGTSLKAEINGQIEPLE